MISKHALARGPSCLHQLIQLMELVDRFVQKIPSASGTRPVAYRHRAVEHARAPHPHYEDDP
jgi:hypothetical protein